MSVCQRIHTPDAFHLKQLHSSYHIITACHSTATCNQPQNNFLFQMK